MIRIVWINRINKRNRIDKIVIMKMMNMMKMMVMIVNTKFTLLSRQRCLCVLAAGRPSGR